MRMVCASRCTTWRTLVSCPVPGTPALRKYLLTTMSVASCDHSAGTSTSCIWKTTEPSGLEITVLRRSQRTWSSGCTPGLVKRRGTRKPAAVGARRSFGMVLSKACVIVDLPVPRATLFLLGEDRAGAAPRQYHDGRDLA